MSKENYDALLTDIQAIAENETLTPGIPVSIYVQEAEDQYEWAKDDEVALTEAGLDLSLLNALPERAGALRYAQSIWQKEYNTYEEAQQQWNTEAPQAFDLHDVLIHDFLHAYNDNPDIISKVRNISTGGGNADMLQDMSDLAVLGKSHPEPLQKIHFNMSLLDQAETITGDLSEVLAKANGLRMGDHESKTIRDKAYTYLKQAVDEVRRNGQYKFWRNEDRKRGYISQYLKRRSASAKKVSSQAV